MDIKSLRCFLMVAEKLNFSRAAENLYLSQPALSLRINNLEKELGVELFQRTRQNVFLTAAGAAILPEVQELVARLDELPLRAAAGARSAMPESGTLKVGLDESLPETMLDELTRKFSAFYEKYPGIDIELPSINYYQYENALLARKADMCFMGLKHSELTHLNPALSSINYKQEAMVLAYTGDPEASFAEIMEKCELLQLENEDRWNQVFLNYLESEHILYHARPVKSSFALDVNLLRPNSATFMPISVAEKLPAPNLFCRHLEIPDDKVLSCFLWDRMNFNPALQLLLNHFTRDLTQERT